MSFSKARIQRFNELTSQVPPPGAYDPKFDSKVKGSVAIDKSAASSTTKADCASSVCSRGSSQSASVKPTFRTPQVPKRRAPPKPTATASCPRARPRQLYKEETAAGARYEPQQELADLRVELRNKDKTIADYEKLLEDVRLETRELEEKHRLLEAQLERVQCQHQQDLERMAALQQQLADQPKDAQLASSLDLGSEISLDDQLDASRISKDLEVAALLQLQSETESRLECARSELERSEKLVADLELQLRLQAGTPRLDSRLAQQMTEVLREHFGCARDEEARWSSDEAAALHPDAERFLGQVKKLAADLRLSYEREIELARDRFNEEREDLEQRLDRQRASTADLQAQLAEAREASDLLGEQLQELRELHKETSHSLQDKQREVERLEARLEEARGAHQAQLESREREHYDEVAYLHGLIEQAKHEYLQEVDKLEKSLEEEKTRMKECADRMIENAEAVTRETLQACRAESEEKVRRIVSETDAKVRDAIKASEDKESKYKACVERLESEKSALVASLSQRDVEINRLTVALEEMKCTAETQESFSQSLQAELDRAEAELVEKKEELRNLKDQLRNESAEMVARRRRFEVVMAENQASVGALAQRLAQCQADNEALERQVRIKETGIEEYRKLLESLSKNSSSLQDRLDSIADSIDHKLDYIGQLETANINEINLAKANLLSNIDHFKGLAIQQLAQSRHKSEQNAELKANLREMSERLNDATDMLLRLEEVNDEQSLQMSKLQLHMAKLEQQVQDKDRQIQEASAACDTHRAQHETEIAEMNAQLSKLEQEAKVWQEKQAQTEAERDRLKELTSKYESQLASLERERSTRQQQQQSDEKCSKQISDLTEGQRTKQIYQLKDKLDLLRLRQELDARCDLMDEAIIAGLMNEKLKIEARRQIGMGKENQLSPLLLSPHKQLFPKSTNTTPVSSPNNKHHPATPLRVRND